MTKIIINGQVRDMTSAEETKLAEDRVVMADAKQIQADAMAQKATDKASAKAKLIAGEALTEEEANTIVL